MSNKTKICCELLDIIDKQGKMIKKQNELIAELTNENLEKENMINELMQEQAGMC